MNPHAQRLLTIRRRIETNDETWTPRGQCLPASLMLHVAFGYDIYHARVQGVHHYFNRAPTGHDLDVTGDQFSDRMPVQIAVGLYDDPDLVNPTSIRGYPVFMAKDLARQAELPRTVEALDTRLPARTEDLPHG